MKRRERAPALRSTEVNWHQKESIDVGRMGQPSGVGTSRIRRAACGQSCEGLGLQFPGGCRRYRVTGIPTAIGGPYGGLRPIAYRSPNLA